MQKRKLYLYVTMFLVSCILFLPYGCGKARRAVQIKGSDTMVNLAQAWAEQFMLNNPRIAVAITGGGSGTGIAALMSKATDIAQCSREMEEKELVMARLRGVNPKEIHVANDGIAIVVHPSNPINKLTLQQLSAIFTGQTNNWKQLGGSDLKIVALSRERNSGTHVFFVEKVVKLGNKKNPNEFASSVLMMPSSQAIVEEIVSNPSAIGYIGLGYLTNKQKAVLIALDTNSAYVYPSVKTVLDKTYPIARSLLFYTNGQVSGEVEQFIDFVLSKEGQQLVLKMDFVPVK